MKKIIILLFLVMFLTGCSADVNIIINDTGINETITFTDSSTTAYKNNIPVFYKDIFSDIEPDVRNEGVEYYTKNVYQESGNYKLNYSYKYSLENYRESRSIKGAFRSFNIRNNKNDGQIVISTDSGGLRYFDSYNNLTNVRVNITPSYKVLENNADYVNGNVYTWVFNKNTKKHIYLMLDNPSTVNDNNNNSGNNENNNSNDKDETKTDTNSNKVDNKKEDSVNNDVKEEKEERFLDKYPYIILIGAIGIFVMFALLLVRVSKSD